MFKRKHGKDFKKPLCRAIWREKRCGLLEKAKRKGSKRRCVEGVREIICLRSGCRSIRVASTFFRAHTPKRVSDEVAFAHLDIGGEDIEASEEWIVLFDPFEQCVIVVVGVGVEGGKPCAELVFRFFEHFLWLCVCAKVPVAKGVCGWSRCAECLNGLEEDIASKGRRCGGSKVRAFGGIEENPCRFCDEKESLPRKSDVVRCMSGGGEYQQRSVCKLSFFFGGYEFFCGYRCKRAVHFGEFAEDFDATFPKAGGFDEMRDALGMTKHAVDGERLEECASTSAVIEVDVCKQDSIQFLDSLLLEVLDQGGYGRSGTGVDDKASAFITEQPSADKVMEAFAGLIEGKQQEVGGDMDGGKCVGVHGCGLTRKARGRIDGGRIVVRHKLFVVGVSISWRRTLCTSAR